MPVVALLALLAGLLVGQEGASGRSAHATTSAAAATVATRAAADTGGSPLSGARRPNIVFVLTDDLSMNLLRFMPQVQALQARGLTFDNYFVSDSLCCPSRSSIFTGNFPHDTGVFTNNGADGGIGAFYSHGDENASVNVALHRAGYRTAMMGKYLNGYLQNWSPVPSTYVPPGWDEWDAVGWGYPEYGYPMNINGTVKQFGHSRRDYLTNVITRRGVSFIDASAQEHKPFFLELATFTPHSPYVPAPRDAHKFPTLNAPRPPSFNVLPANPPSWLAPHPPLTHHQIDSINRAFRLRVRDVQSIDRMLATIEDTLRARGIAQNTYIVFSSDNGLHTGEYRLMPGKLTAFDTDIHVPLVIAGPGVPPGSRTSAVTQNIDLASTFGSIAGVSFKSDGHSLRPLLQNPQLRTWANTALIEHHGPAPSVDNPDAQPLVSGNPPSYEAMRTPNFLYVEYADGEIEYYALRDDPFELDNIAGTLSTVRLLQLHQELTALENCHGPSACWRAAHIR